MNVRNRLKMASMVALLVGLVVGVSGCTSTQNPLTGGQTSNKAKAYADAWMNYSESHQGPNETTTFKVIENGTDSVRISGTTTNTTPSGFWANGTTTTSALNVKYFSNKDEATKFYDNVSFGYTASSAKELSNLTTPDNNIYKQVTGHDATINSGAWKLINFSFVSLSASVAVQQDEFVIWGDISVMPK